LLLGGGKQFTVLQGRSAELEGRGNMVPDKQVTQWGGWALIEKDAHLRRCERTLGGVFQDGPRLLDRDAGE
jgi:hypothetical protein